MCSGRIWGELADWFDIDCGHLREGALADINILNPACFDQITEEVAEAPIEEFNDYARLVNRHPGVVTQVLVGGQLIGNGDRFVPGYGVQQQDGRFLKKGRYRDKDLVTEGWTLAASTAAP